MWAADTINSTVELFYEKKVNGNIVEKWFIKFLLCRSKLHYLSKLCLSVCGKTLTKWL